jgi:hypothetical protein
LSYSHSFPQKTFLHRTNLPHLPVDAFDYCGWIFLVLKICESLKNLGYARSNHIRLYGEQFELVSDTFPYETGIAVEVVQRDGKNPPTIKLPLSILNMATAKSA